MPATQVSSEDAAERVRATLAESAKPMTYSRLKTATHLDITSLTMGLEAATNHGLVFRWPDYAGSSRFWTKSPEQEAKAAILNIATEEALTRTKLVESARKRVPGLSEHVMNLFVAGLLAAKDLQVVPAFTAGRLLMRSGVPAAYEATARKFIAEKFRKAGLDPARLFAAVIIPGAASGNAVTDSASAILQAISVLDPAPGVPFSIQRLRNQLPNLSKREFDRAALQLRNEQKVFLSLHHDPHTIPIEERNLLVDGGDGRFYVALVVRGS